MEQPSQKSKKTPLRGRGAQSQPANRFLTVHNEADYEHLAPGDDYPAEIARRKTSYLDDHSQTIVSENDSPDIPFRYSINPYRGCEHGCSYCYARPTHEYLGLSAGVDFESRIMVKREAPRLFRRWLGRRGYQPAPVAFSGVTDCYQPIERELRLTRGCLEVAADCLQPIVVVTKNALVTRDIDLLGKLAEHRAAVVAVSVTTLDAELARVMEPRTSSPAARLRVIRELSAAGVPVHAMLAPVIPGLNDSELPALLEAARDAGARSASAQLLRLSSTVRPVFLEWLDRLQPTRRDRVLTLLRSMRSGKLNDPRFGVRMRGEGPYADHLHQTVAVLRKRLGLAARPPELNTGHFRPPDQAGQKLLF